MKTVWGKSFINFVKTNLINVNNYLWTLDKNKQVLNANLIINNCNIV